MTLMATLVLSPGWWGLGKYFFFRRKFGNSERRESELKVL